MYRQLIMDYLAGLLEDVAVIRQDYPMETPAAPVVTYSEAANNAHTTLDGHEFLTEYEPQIDVYAPDMQTAEQIAGIVSDGMRRMGFKRTASDGAPIDGIRHITLHFHGLIGPGNIIYQ